MPRSVERVGIPPRLPPRILSIMHTLLLALFRKRTWLTLSLCAIAFWYFSRVGAHTLRTTTKSPVTTEHGIYTPVVFDKTRHTVMLEFAECSNLALAPENVGCPAGAQCGEQLYIVFIRCNESRGKRWGTTNVVGLVNISKLDIRGDPSVATTTSKPSKVLRGPHVTARSHYHSLLDFAVKTHYVYPSAAWAVYLEQGGVMPAHHMRTSGKIPDFIVEREGGVNESVDYTTATDLACTHDAKPIPVAKGREHANTRTGVGI